MRPQEALARLRPGLPGVALEEPLLAGIGAGIGASVVALIVAVFSFAQLPSERASKREVRLTTAVLGGGSMLAFILDLAVNRELRRSVLERKRDRALIDAQARRIADLEVQNQVLDAQLDGLTLAEADGARAQAELVQASAALARAHRDLDQFGYVASHDLKAPLRGIASLADWLEDDLGPTLSAKSKEQLRLLHGRVDRMEGLIEGILAYARASRTKGVRGPLEVAPFLREVVALAGVDARAVTIDVPEAMPPLLCEAASFQQVWLSLLDNAWKHGSPGDKQGADIRLAVKDAGDAWEFSVSDNGPGIAPEYHERIFGIFQTLASRDKVEGAGIGLAIARRLVDDRGGRVWIESEPGKGARFCFTWPKT